MPQVPSFVPARSPGAAGGNKKSVLVRGGGGGSGTPKGLPHKPTVKKPVAKKLSVKGGLPGKRPPKPVKPAAKIARPKKSKLVPGHTKPSTSKPSAHKPSVHKPAVHKPKKPTASGKSLLHKSPAARSKKSVLVGGGAPGHQHAGHLPTHPASSGAKGKLKGPTAPHHPPLKPKKPGAKAPKGIGAFVKRIRGPQAGGSSAT
jgi:hypothetical protein